MTVQLTASGELRLMNLTAKQAAGLSCVLCDKTGDTAPTPLTPIGRLAGVGVELMACPRCSRCL